MSTLTINLHPTPKQDQAWSYLNDQLTTELLYGGAAGGGKSRLLCEWEASSAIRYPGSRWLLGRAVLKSLKESTLLTLFEVLSDWQLKPNQHYRYNQQDNTITFWNGSVIYLKDLFAYPSDPNFDSLGSTEFTGAGIDEANQVTAKAKEVVKSRLRYKLDIFGLIPKLLLTCNPAKNWTYSDFYLPWRNGTLPPSRAFVQSLVTDNPHISPHYVESLRNLRDKALKERLYFGNWEYDDDPNALFSIDALNDLFSNPVERGDDNYLTVDVARFGRDKSVLMVWEGLVVTEIQTMDKSATTEVVAGIEGLRLKHGIPASRTLVDEDGVGGGVVDQGGYKGFVGGSSALEDKRHAKFEFKLNYANLRGQCYYTLAEVVQKRLMKIETDDMVVYETIIGDLEQVKAKDPDKDTKLRVIAKDEIKEHLGRSPDYGDCLMMRMFFELDPTPVPNIRVL